MDKKKGSQNWAEKHRVLKFDELKGQGHAVIELKKFFNNFPHGKKAILFHGPAGTGKTSLAYIARNEYDFEVYELNASDFRSKDQLEIKLKPALEQSSLFKKGKIILVDEVDGLSSLGDRGGIPELLELIDKAQFPILITANKIWDSKFGELRKKSLLVPFKEIDYRDISVILQGIAKREGLGLNNQIITSLAVKSKGDVRAAINDLQAIASYNNLIDSKDLIPLLDERNKEIDIFQALKLVFKNLLTQDSLRIYDNVDLPLEKIFLWIEENIPYEYSGEELFKAYESLSIADVFRGRIRRQRHWRFLIYQNIFLSAGISLAKKKPKVGFTHYQRPTRVLKIWTYNQRQQHKKSIIIKYAKHTHCSKRKAGYEFNFIKSFLLNQDIQKRLDLNDKEIKYLKELD
ncbi:replication factor C large subunit [Candidatus Pacearchaeota archaeon]|nr:replication factor C large subunit [Candidatus Pacearchaeota archaeon]